MGRRRSSGGARTGLGLVVLLVVTALGLVWGAGVLSREDDGDGPSLGAIFTGDDDDVGDSESENAASGWAPMVAASLGADEHVDVGGTADAVALGTLGTTVASAPVVVTVDEADGPRFDEAATLATQLAAPVVVVGASGGPTAPVPTASTPTNAAAMSDAATMSAGADAPQVATVDQLLAQWNPAHVVAIGTPPVTSATVHTITVQIATATSSPGTDGQATPAGATSDAGGPTDGTQQVVVELPDEVTAMVEAAVSTPPVGGAEPPIMVVVRQDDAGTPLLRADAVTTLTNLGATVTVWTQDDPRRDDALRASVAATESGWVLAVATQDRPTPDDADWDAVVAAAATAPELPGGGLVLFPDRVFVAAYGNPVGPALGVLGERDVQGSIAYTKELAAQYDGMFGPDVQVQPAFELIATIASSAAEPTGDYSRREDLELVTEWVDAATEAGLYVVLDLQPGRTDFLTQARELEELLVRPNVGLALDPEWRLTDSQFHMQQIGTVDTAEVNEVSAWLAQVVADNNLPQKLLIIHSFRLAMLTNRDTLVDHLELAQMIHVDGQGAQDDKDATYASITSAGPDFLWWGWKNFFDEDVGLRSPEDTAAVEPQPNFISYQ